MLVLTSMAVLTEDWEIDVQKSRRNEKTKKGEKRT